MQTQRGVGGAILHVLFLRGGACPAEALPGLLTRLRASPTDKALSMAVLRLRRRRLVMSLRRPSGPVLRLTQRGRQSVVPPSLRAAAPPAPRGLVYFVSYDIPSDRDVDRNAFREILRRHGWRRLHKSLWVVERDIRDTALRAAEDLDVRPYIFIGTGALLEDRVPPARPEFVEEMCLAAAGVVADAKENPAEAYRRWSEMTHRLRSPGGSTQVAGRACEAWASATRALRAVLAAP